MTFQDLDNWRHYLADEIFPNGKERIRVCTGTACLASGAKAVIEGIEAEIKQKGRDVEVTKTGCQGLCQKGPLVQIDPQGYFYQRVRRSDAADLVTNALSSGPPIRHLLYRDSGMSEPCERLSSIPFYEKQNRIVLRNNGRIDPTNIRHYIARGGYAALEKVYGLANAEYYAGRDALQQARLSSGNQALAWLSLAVTFFTRCQAHAAQVKEALVAPATSPSDLGLRPFGGDWAEWETRIK